MCLKSVRALSFHDSPGRPRPWAKNVGGRREGLPPGVRCGERVITLPGVTDLVSNKKQKGHLTCPSQTPRREREFEFPEKSLRTTRDPGATDSD